MIVEGRRQVLLDFFGAHPERFVNGAPKPPEIPSAAWINPPTTKTTHQIGAQAVSEASDDLQVPLICNIYGEPVVSNSAASVTRTQHNQVGWMLAHRESAALLFFTLNREDFSFVIHLDRQPRTSRRREAQTGSRARSGSCSERTLDAVEHSRTLMEWWPFLIFHRGGLRIKVINNTRSPNASSPRAVASRTLNPTSSPFTRTVAAR